jgi:hypothetical protein
MRTIVGISLAGVLTCAGAGVANADAMSLYLQGHGGYAGANLKRIEPGEDSSLGALLGAEVGGKILAFTGYVGFDDYLSRGTVTRAILGFGTDLGFQGWKLSGRIGAGLMIEKDGVFGGMTQVSDRTGIVGRAGVAFDRTISSGLYIGVGVDGEYFALKPTDDGAVDTSVHTGADVLGSLHIGFELGL